MSLTTLLSVAERAAAASINGRMILIDVSTNGVTVAGRALIPGNRTNHSLADAADNPDRLYSAMMLARWDEIAIDGVLPVERALDRVIAALDAKGGA